jgi:membrane protease subunit (stomatin/prohibitin family)
MQELRPAFIQCPKCNSWVRRKKCWNTQRGLCKNCAPDLGVEMAAAQANKMVEDVQTSAQTDEEDSKVIKDTRSWQKKVQVSCPHCNAPLAAGVKFCPECGAKLQREAFCTECGAKVPPGAKFCPECGAKAGA